MNQTSVDIWMPLYIGDYLADTMRLSTEQHGAYLLLIMEYWRSGPLLNDDEELAAITRLPPDVWAKHRPKLARFFNTDGQFWTHSRINAERERAEARRVAARENGRKGGRPRKAKKPNDNPEDNPEKTHRFSSAKPNGNPTPNPEKSSSPSPSPSPLPISNRYASRGAE